MAVLRLSCPTPVPQSPWSIKAQAPGDLAIPRSPAPGVSEQGSTVRRSARCQNLGEILSLALTSAGAFRGVAWQIPLPWRHAEKPQ